MVKKSRDHDGAMHLVALVPEHAMPVLASSLLFADRLAGKGMYRLEELRHFPLDLV